MITGRRCRTQGARFRFCACAVMVSSFALSCGRRIDENPAPEPAQADQQEIPHFIPPKGKQATADAAAPLQSAPQALPAPFPPARGCPENMARVRGFCIDRFEIHLVNRDGSVHPYFQKPPYGMDGLSARSGPGVFPQGYLSQETSAKACVNAGKRLCTLEEWQAACNGGGSRRFPYGNGGAPGRCNVNKREPHILDKHFPDIPHMKRAGRHFNDPALLQDPDYLERAGQRAMCTTPEGIYDMDGNLSEWVGDTAQKPDGLHGTFAGDAFSGAGVQGCGRSTSAHAAGYHDYSMGTRCCKDAR